METRGYAIVEIGNSLEVLNEYLGRERWVNRSTSAVGVVSDCLQVADTVFVPFVGPKIVSGEVRHDLVKPPYCLSRKQSQVELVLRGAAEIFGRRTNHRDEVGMET